MRQTIAVALLLLMGLSAAPKADAQQIPYLNELFGRYAAFSRLYREKQRAGADLSVIEPLRLKGEAAFRRGNIPGILETLGEAITRLNGQPWDDRHHFFVSLTLETDRLVIEPNQDINVALARMFPTALDKAFPSAPPGVSFAVRPERGGQPIPLATAIPVAETATTAGRKLILPDGAYTVAATLTAGAEKVAEFTRPVYAIADFNGRVARLNALVAAIKSAADPKVRAVAPLVSTPEFQLQRLAPLNRTRGEDDVNPIEELARVEGHLTALSRGENPFLNERGEVERAYQASDGKLIPYRVYVPKSYDGAAARPLVLLLHGALGDERYYFSGLFDPETVRGEAERRGVILAGVNGRGRLSGYRGLGLEDSFEVIKAVTRDYRIDPARVYVTGHSMGGFGTWLVAAHRPEMFAAIAPVSSGAPPPADQFPELLARVKDMAALVVHGAKDGIMPAARSRDAVEAAKKAGLRVEYLEVAEADHVTILAPTFGRILDFFDKHPKPVK